MMRLTKVLVAIFFMLIFDQPSLAQLKTPPRIEWQRSLGGSKDEIARSVQQTRDGGYIVAGYSNSFNVDLDSVNYHDDDYWVVKLSLLGMIEWKGLYGGNRQDVAGSILETRDGYIIAGYSGSDDVDVKDHNEADDIWIVKLGGDSAIKWSMSLGGSSNDHSYSVRPTFDGGYIIVGTSSSTDSMIVDNHGSSDYWVVKLDSNSASEWSRSFGGSASDFGSSIQQTSDSGYIIAGESNSNDGNITGHHGERDISDYGIIKLSKDGSIDWQRSLGGTEHDGATDIRQTADGGYIVVGFSGSTDGDVNGHFAANDMWVVKLTSGGSIEWDRSLGGTEYDEANSVCETTDGGYVIAGATFSDDGNVSFNHGGYDYWLVKLSNTGILEWERSYGGSQQDLAYSLQQTTDGGFIVAGYSKSNDGDVTGNHGGSDFWIVKLSPENPSSVGDEPTALHPALITPNPAQTDALLTLESNEEGICEVQIISVTGITLKQYSTHLTTGEQEIELTDLESLPSGMYEVLIKRNGYLMLQTKLIIE